jgi:hypothetical protein
MPGFFMTVCHRGMGSTLPRNSNKTFIFCEISTSQAFFLSKITILNPWLGESLMTLSLVRPIKDRHKSHARWADNPNGDLIIFIPGFVGNSLSTWVEFPRLISRPHIRNTDILFFGHNGGRSQIRTIVGLLSASIDKLWDHPKKFSTFPRLRPEQFRYRRIFLCGHSMGCVAVRDVVVAAAEQNKEWVESIAMVMFAPAHKGISASLLMLEKFAKAHRVIGQWASVAFSYRYPAVDEIRPGSPYLMKLETRTNSIVGRATLSENVLPKTIVFGEMDKTVSLERFSNDPEPMFFEAKNHTTVCKPIVSTFEEPYNILAQVLR